MQSLLFRKYSTACIALFITVFATAQVNSPYSRFGVGNIFPQTYTASNGMGGLSAAYFSSYNLNFLNPSSYSYLNYATFEAGGFGNFLTLHDGTDKFTSGDGNLSYLALGFPMLKKKHSQFGISTGLLPYSGYQYDVLKDIESADTLLGTQSYRYRGDGSLYQFYGGLGYRIIIDTTNIVSLGFNGAYLFGSLQSSTVASFPDQVNAINTKLIRDNKIDGFTWNYGVGYEKILSKKDQKEKDQKIYNVFDIGFSGNPSLTVNGSQSVSWFNIVTVGESESITDTLYLAPDTSGNVTLPAQFRIGFTYKNYIIEHYDEHRVLYAIGAEYSSSSWGNYEGIQSAGVLVNSNRISVGAQITPVYVVKQKRPLNYRAGFYFGNSNLEIDGEQLKDLGVTFGVGVPIGLGKQSYANGLYSKLNLAVTIGQRASTNTIKETYFNVNVGFNLNDFGWFIKPQIK